MVLCPLVSRESRTRPGNHEAELTRLRLFFLVLTFAMLGYMAKSHTHGARLGLPDGFGFIAAAATQQHRVPIKGKSDTSPRFQKIYKVRLPQFRTCRIVRVSHTGTSCSARTRCDLDSAATRA